MHVKGPRSARNARRCDHREAITQAAKTPAPDCVLLFLSGDVILGRGIDQLLPYPGDPRLHETFVRSALDYVGLAEAATGAIPRAVAFDYVWGDALSELARAKAAGADRQPRNEHCRRGSTIG